MFDIVFLTLAAIAIIFGIMKKNVFLHVFMTLALAIAITQGIVTGNQTLTLFASVVVFSNLWGLYREIITAKAGKR